MATAELPITALMEDHVHMIQPSPQDNPDVLFDQICQNVPDRAIEQDAEGIVYIMPPTGGETSNRNSELTAQLQIWAKRNGRGRSVDSNVTIVLPDRSKRSPDACWVSLERLKALSPAERKQRLKVVPEFVIELASPTDNLEKLKRKMDSYIACGVELGWLIDPDARRVHIYGSTEVRLLDNARYAEGEGSVAGFRLDLQPIWEGLESL